jgi:alkylated DNA repair protein alkB family protein 8
MNYEEKTKQAYSNLAKVWDSKRPQVWGPVKNFLESSKKGELLEVGCGSGRHLVFAQALGFSSLKGIDYALGLIDICKEKNLNVECADLRDLPFDNQSFDLLLCIAVLQHLTSGADREKGLRELRRVMREDAQLLLSIWLKPEKMNEKKFREVEKNLFRVSLDKEEERYYYFFEEGECEELFKKVGLKIKERILEERDGKQKNVYYVLEKQLISTDSNKTL